MEMIYLSLHCHHQNDSRIKMGRDESHYNVSLIIIGRDKVVTRLCPQTTTFLSEEKGGSGIEPHNVFEEKGRPKRNRTPQRF